MWNADDEVERAEWIDRILKVDEQFLTEHPESTLFAYFAGTPKKAVLEQSDLLSEWEAEERRREQRAAERGGEYYERNPLAAALIALEEQRAETAAAQAEVGRLQTQLSDLQSSLLYSKCRQLLDSKPVRAVRRNPAVSRLEGRVRHLAGRT